MTKDPTPDVAPAGDSLPWYCPLCGLRYAIQGVCTGRPESPHATQPTVTEPITDEHKAADEAAANFVPVEPADGSSEASPAEQLATSRAETVAANASAVAQVQQAASQVPELMARIATLERANAEQEAELASLRAAANEPPQEGAAPAASSTPDEFPKG